MDILISIITSTTVVGILTFIFKEKYKHKITLLSKDIDSLKTYKAKDFDYTNQAIKNIWHELALIDDYLRHGLAQDIESGILSNLKLRPFLLNIKKETILLPNELYNLTEKCLDDMSESWSNELSKVVNDINLVKSNKLTENKCMENTNNNLNNLRKTFSTSLLKLRKKYRDYITNHWKKNE